VAPTTCLDLRNPEDSDDPAHSVHRQCAGIKYHKVSAQSDQFQKSRFGYVAGRYSGSRDIVNLILNSQEDAAVFRLISLTLP
jgi:hypothetical protein